MAKKTRREFVQQTMLGAAAFLAYPPARVLGANDRVRIGMIGVGGRGQELLKQVMELPKAQVVAIADVYTRRHDEAKQIANGIQTVNDHRRLLDIKDIDAVIVASPLHIHAQHFLDTLAAGKDLYAEKTMTWSIPEAEQCLQAAKISDRIIQIGLQHESSGALADARKWIKDGLLGKVTQVESWMSRNTPHGKGQWVRPVPSDCTATNVDWNAFLNGRPNRPFDANKFINWRLFWEFSGGNVTENMVHQIAWIMSALDLPLPSAAYMSGGVFSEKDGREVPDTIAVTLDFPNDMVVTWQSTFSNSRYGLGERLLGSDGTIEHLAASPAKPLIIFPKRLIGGMGSRSLETAQTRITCPTGLSVCALAKLLTLRWTLATGRRSRRTWLIWLTAASSASLWRRRSQLKSNSELSDRNLASHTNF